MEQQPQQAKQQGNGQQQQRKESTRTRSPGFADSGLRVRGQQKVWHHLFKSDVKDLLKNVSFRKNDPKIEKIPHTHIFHTINSQFRPQTITQVVAGHFHEVEWGQKEDGTPFIKSVSQPMRYQYVSKPSGQKKVKVPVKFFSAELEQDIVDTHVHRFDYIHSEQLTEEGIRGIQVDNARGVQQSNEDVGLEDAGTGGTD